MRAITEGGELQLADGRKGRVIATQGPDPERPIGVVVEDRSGKQTVEWVPDLPALDEFWVAVYLIRRIGPVAKVFTSLDDFRPDYAPDALLELRHYTHSDDGWVSEPAEPEQ